MRALCGAIITAAALIGLGLTAQGIGTRYANEPAYYSDYDRIAKEKQEKEGSDPKKTPTSIAKPPRVLLGDMDRPLIFILVFLTSMALIGLGIAILGLAYHHMRRDREHQWERERAAVQQRTTV